MCLILSIFLKQGTRIMKKISLLVMAVATVGMLTGCNKNKGHTNVGLLYCSAEANSLYQVNVVKAELEKKGLSTKLISFSDSNDISSVLNGSIDNIDTLYIPTDNTCASNAETIDAIVRSKGKPVFAGEEGICKGCGAITLSISYYSIGVKTGKMAVDVLLGKSNIAELPIAYDEHPVKKYNKDFCDELNIQVPSDYIDINATGGESQTPDVAFQNTENRHFTIGISQLVTHDALDAATKGFMDAVRLGLGEANVTFDNQNASGQIDMCTTIANNFVAQNVDLIMANATPALQAAANSTTSIPILGTSVTEYGVALGIENFNGIVGSNVSGTSDLAPLTEQANMLAEVFANYMK